MRKTQTILLVLFFMVLVVLLTTTLFFLMRHQMRTQRQREYALAAFYLAQAGIELAKIDTLSDYWAPGTYYFPGDPDAWSDDLDQDPADDYQYQYNYTLYNPGNTTRVIIGQGRVLKDGEILAFKRLQAEIAYIEDTLGDGQDDDLEGTQTSWEEL